MSDKIIRTVKLKNVKIPKTAVAGASIEVTSKSIGTVLNLIGVSADRIISIEPKEIQVSPATIVTLAIYQDALYVGGTQTCTLLNDMNITVAYI